MDIKIDGVTFQLRHIDSFSREELLEMVKEEIAAQGKVLTDILCMGESLEEKDFLTIPDALEVSFISSTEEELLCEVCSEAVTSLERVQSSVKKWIDLLSVSNPVDSKELEDIKNELLWLVDLVDRSSDAFTGEVNINFPSSRISSLSDDIQSFSSYLEEGAYQSVLLRLEEDVMPELDSLVGLFKETRDEWSDK